MVEEGIVCLLACALSPSVPPRLSLSHSLPDYLSWNLNLLPWYKGLQSLSVISPPVVQLSGFDTKSFPTSLACGRQINGLLSLHSHINQFHITNLSLYIRSCRFYVSGGPCLIQYFTFVKLVVEHDTQRMTQIPDIG